MGEVGIGVGGVGQGNKTHDLTKRRVFFNVRSCMNLQRWMDATKQSVPSGLNIHDAHTVVKDGKRKM